MSDTTNNTTFDASLPGDHALTSPDSGNSDRGTDTATEDETQHTASDVPDEPETQTLESQVEAILAKWKVHISGLSAKERHELLLNMLTDYLRMRLAIYFRRFPERLTSSEKTYTDRCVGREELITYMGHVDNEGHCANWLTTRHVPPLELTWVQLLLNKAQIQVLLEHSPDIPFAAIGRNFGLSFLEFEILATLVMAMSDERHLRAMTVAWADFSVRLPTVSFLCGLLDDPDHPYDDILLALSPQSTLRRMRLIIAHDHACFPGCTPLTYTPLVVEQSVIEAFQGRSTMRRFAPSITLHQEGLPLRTLIADETVRAELEYFIENKKGRLLLVGAPHSGRRSLVCALACHKMKKNILEINLSQEIDHHPKFGPRFAELMRDALLNDAMLMLRLDSIESSETRLKLFEDACDPIANLIEHFPSPLILLSNTTHAAFERAFRKPPTIQLPPPTLEMMRETWLQALTPWVDPNDATHMAETFARNYQLPLGTIFKIMHDAQQSVQPESQFIQSHHILNEIRKSFDHQLGTLADVTVSDVQLGGVILTPKAREDVDEILKYAKNLHTVLDAWGFRERSPYGNALSVLFSGPPGTGKTFLACALANELGKVLYRIDLSRVVDKYIGETEKNLGRIFDEASKAQAIILFDEADSLFAKRTEVKSSNDRYANLEINYLLQKLESYNGITILTTNLAKSIDDAFRRRIRFIVEFPMPDVHARIELWKRMMPPQAPISRSIHWHWLAKTFEMSGGHIRNAVLKASIHAASKNSPITMKLLAKAAADEARSIGSLFRISDFEDFDDEDEFDA
ncbi:MAG: AAA family ATPase [Proteobacteria bacterium]|nr:AAA family ATPase [Pseudomonadota bacterium]MCL2325480.1 AAA family ATPase [Pseudomonadota bacterium]